MDKKLEKIKVGFCVAYDWEMLKYSIPPVYKEADVICLSIDSNHRSWSGEPYAWDEDSFRKLIAELDPMGKITIYEDQFYLPNLTPIENDTRQRNRMADFLGKEDGWHIQIDSDEFFIDFEGFAAFLKQFKSDRKVNIRCPLINLYKILPGGVLWVKPNSFEEIEYANIATKYPYYESARINGYFNVIANFPIIHQSWARSSEEMWRKLNSWGHSKDFDVSRYYNLWKNANSRNYKTYKNIHYLTGETWPSLELQSKVNSIQEAILLNNNDFPLPITDWNLKKANSIWLSRIKSALRIPSGR
ncbi:hypothetical protein [Adhaeribacter radiodurans]|uniref:Glycosyltransferase n=1 Tax=Adhaeribacter radiodurans TaxID=2745197 RepID=A0A7L7L440_9BACT|nr:hypothetical protein [Adhaeribacter radiodurans]QMU27566.1 hypothetical protein HUW48_05705 [Adhaeribacter radiodurans]